MNEENTNGRNSNIELLRLVLMLFVVLLHFNNDEMGGAFVLIKNYPIENTFLRMLEAFSVSAVNCFMIVSGYFLFSNSKIRFSKVFSILLIVIFYRFLDYVCRLFILSEPFSMYHFIGAFLPTSYFAIFYIICYLFSPFISKIFREVNDFSVNFLMFFLLIIFILIPTILDIANDLRVIKDPGLLSPISLKGNGDGYTIVQFFVMLCLGMWIRRSKINPRTWILISIYCISSILIMILQNKIETYSYNFVLNVLSAFCLFLLFNKFKIQSKLINSAAQSCFSIYCIHISFFANFIWRKYFITQQNLTNGLLGTVIWTFLGVFCMFFSCLLFSILIRMTFGKIKNKICSLLPVVIIENVQ